MPLQRQYGGGGRAQQVDQDHQNHDRACGRRLHKRIGFSGFQIISAMMKGSMSHDPPVELAFPAHLTWAAHKMDVQETEVFDRWVARTSSKALRESGVTEIEKEQTRVWSERIAGIFRLEDYQTSVQEAFNLERDWDLEEFVASFVEPMSVMLEIENFDCIDVTVDVGKEALQKLEQTHMPNAKEGRPGTLLGSTWSMYPRAMSLYLTAAATVKLAVHTQQAILPFQSAFEATSEALSTTSSQARLRGCGLTTSALETMEAAAQSFEVLCNDELLEMCRPTRAMQLIKDYRDLALDLSWTLALALLNPILVATTTADTVFAWRATTSAQTDHLDKVAGVARRSASLLGDFDECRAGLAVGLATWVHQVSAIVSGECTPTPPQVKELSFSNKK